MSIYNGYEVMPRGEKFAVVFNSAVTPGKTITFNEEGLVAKIENLEAKGRITSPEREALQDLRSAKATATLSQ